MMFKHPPVFFRQFVLLLVAAAFVAGGCSASKQVQNPETFDSETASYTLIYMIHGDADYLYHEEGKAQRADRKALTKAFEVATKAEHGEVFIFHQKPEKRALFLFPKKDRRFYHYKNGLLVDWGKYSPSDGGFGKEADIFKEKWISESSRTFFFYFGHEIPTFSDEAYHRSLPEKTFDTRIFANDLARFTDSFELTVLSTCNNGSPYTIRQLIDKTNAVVASPHNLHLSYFDTEEVLLLEKEPDIETLYVADRIAESSFNRLSGSLQTTVSVAVYDLKNISSDFDRVYEPYKEHLQTVRSSHRTSENIDCFSLPQYASTPKPGGVQIYYSAAQFGKKNSTAASHSGWGCKE